LAIASVAITAGCSTSSAIEASPSTQAVQDGAHPVRVTAPAVAAPSTTVPSPTTLPIKHVAPPRIAARPSPPPTSPPTTLVIPVAPPTTPTTHPAAPRVSAPQPGANPSASMPPDPDFFDVCSSRSLELTGTCEQEALQAIDRARASENLGPMELPSDWSALTPAEQLFVATNLERTARGLAPFEGIAIELEPAAQAGANSGSDPVPPGGFPSDHWTSNAGEGFASPLGALYTWMYDDGANSPNADCTPGDSGGCWGHRDNILASFSCSPCVVGSADTPGASWSELMADTTGAPVLSFAWSSVN
jgi:hypothetical protein